jgi:hypothetical protein
VWTDFAMNFAQRVSRSTRNGHSVPGGREDLDAPTGRSRRSPEEPDVLRPSGCAPLALPRPLTDDAGHGLRRPPLAQKRRGPGHELLDPGLGGAPCRVRTDDLRFTSR